MYAMCFCCASLVFKRRLSFLPLSRSVVLAINSSLVRFAIEHEYRADPAGSDEARQGPVRVREGEGEKSRGVVEA